MWVLESSAKTYVKHVQYILTSMINNRAETIRNSLQKLSAGNNTLPLTISADANAKHQDVVTAMDVAARLGFTQINIATVNDPVE